jgi:hypothetical protein
MQISTGPKHALRAVQEVPGTQGKLDSRRCPENAQIDQLWRASRILRVFYSSSWSQPPELQIAA